jgi:nucleoside-diphosphate-sugar epimerase
VGGVTETSPLAPTVEVKDRYSAHYGASKWAAQAVLRSAQERFGLPVTIFRGDMMLPHRRYRRQVNAPDVFARLLQSLVLTGLAPDSFYGTAPDGSRPKAHYDGLPVDFIASAIVAVAMGCDGGIETFHVVNPHEDDGISLDTVVDWIDAAGYRYSASTAITSGSAVSRTRCTPCPTPSVSGRRCRCSTRCGTRPRLSRSRSAATSSSPPSGGWHPSRRSRICRRNSSASASTTWCCSNSFRSASRWPDVSAI